MKGKHGCILVGIASFAFVAGCAAPGRSTEVSGTAQAPPVEVLELGDVDIPPRSIRTVRPLYPFTLADRNVRATVDLTIVVLADGKVGDVKIDSSTNKEFDAFAIETVKQFEYLPAILEDKPVACHVRITLEYNKLKPKK